MYGTAEAVPLSKASTPQPNHPSDPAMTSKQAPRQTLTAPIRRQRFTFVALFFIVWTLAISARLVWIQVFNHQKWVSIAARQQTGAFEVAPRRGVLYDRNLKELAMTMLVDSVYAVPSELGENRETAAQMLAADRA